MFDRQALLSVGGYSPELIRYGWFGWEDYDLWLKLAQAGHSCAFCPQIVAAYRAHRSSMVRATLHYKPRLVRYFRRKFAALAARYPAGPRQFGWAGK
jgi:GT2 family glycosyltransferase